MSLATDDDCLSIKNGETGTFPISSVYPISPWIPVKEDWSVNTLGEPIGVKMFKYEVPFCHWKMVVFFYGTPLTGTAMFCGDFREMVVVEKGLYFGKNMVAIMSPDLTEVTLFLNPRNGECIKHKYKWKTIETMSANEKEKVKQQQVIVRQSMAIMHQFDEQCEAFKKGKLTKDQTDNKFVASVKEALTENQIDVIPYNVDGLGSGPQPLSVYKFERILTDINMGNDMGVLIHINGQMMAMSLVAKGVVIDVARITVIPDFSIKKNSITCGDQLVFTRDAKDENLFTVVAKWDRKVCSSTRYVLINEGGRLRRQELFPSVIEDTGNECESLMKIESQKEKDENKLKEVRMLQMKVLEPRTEENDLMEYLS